VIAHRAARGPFVYKLALGDQRVPEHCTLTVRKGVIIVEQGECDADAVPGRREIRKEKNMTSLTLFCDTFGEQ
jgi:hypothetical protein